MFDRPPKPRLVNMSAAFQRTSVKRVKLPDGFKIETQATRTTPMKPPEIPGLRRCHWIDGDMRLGTATWCCKPTTKGTDYCKKHLIRLFQSEN